MKDELNGDSQFRDEINSEKTREIDQDDADVLEDRFRIDRKKLEQMLQPGANGETGLAQAFFEQIMRQTDTIITWPLKLKIGAKSKKDPHVTIKGKRPDVEQAKSLLNRTFDTKSGHVSLKMDIAHDEHSFIIGKGGRGSKEVAKATGAQIHFPDVNRNVASRKSNQVSLRGTLENVEAARQRLRGLMSLTFYFYVKRNYLAEKAFEKAVFCLKDIPGVKLKMEDCNNEAMRVILKGSEENCDLVKSYVKEVLKIVVGEGWMRAIVYNSLEILAENQPFVRGHRGSNISEVERATGANICFVQQQPFSIVRTCILPSKVEISGHDVDCVYEARQKLMGLLPLILVFEMDQNLDCSNVSCPEDVKIDFRPNETKSVKSITLKTSEMKVSSLYEIHGKFMKLVPSRKVLPFNLALPLPIPIPTPPSSIVTALTAKPEERLLLGNSSLSDLMNFCVPEFSRQTGSSTLSSTASSLSTPGHSPDRGSPIERITTNSVHNALNEFDIVTDCGDLGPRAIRRASADSPPKMQYQSRVEQESTRQEFNPYYSMWREADEAMHHHFQGPEFRVPNDRFASRGYSKSVPQNVLRLMSSESSKDPWSDPSCNADIIPGASNRFEGFSTLVREGVKIEDCKTLRQLLHAINMEKYSTVLEAQEVDLETFPFLSNEDLINMGIDNIGPRQKMLALMREMKMKRTSDFCLAPGAERSNWNKRFGLLHSNGYY